ncbi:hypothetical protein BRC71_00750 [Halobacteriales archaeon QH_7_65_31]|nr:MAG: hypothetical protein BRC71_00750 [Halobacteriales archaeon QH_7_65_31]
MEEYKMRRGEYLEERVPDLEATVESYFGEITDTQEYNGSELFVVGEPDNPVFEHIVAGSMNYAGKKDTLAVDFVERELAALMETDDVDAAGDANSLKNEFLLEATGRDAKARRDSMKRDVEDDAPDDF